MFSPHPIETLQKSPIQHTLEGLASIIDSSIFQSRDNNRVIKEASVRIEELEKQRYIDLFLLLFQFTSHQCHHS